MRHSAELLLIHLAYERYIVTPRIHRHVKSEIAVAVMAVFPDFQEWCRQNSTVRDTAWLI
jgi:hypothetical protein